MRIREGQTSYTSYGIERPTFSYLSKELNYNDSDSIFYLMPDSIYLRIISWFFDEAKTLSKQTDTTKIIFFTEELWATGNLNYYRGKFNLPISELLKHKENKYIYLIKKKPKLAKYRKGWANRRKYFNLFLKTLNK